MKYINFFLKKPLKVIIFLFIALVSLKSNAANAAETIWGFDTSADYTISDTREVNINTSKVSLKDGVFLSTLSTLDTPGFSFEGTLSVDNQTLYVADNNGIQIIDVANPALPTILGSFILEPGDAIKVEISNSGVLYYLSANTNKLVAVNVANPTNPSFLSQFSITGIRDFVFSSNQNFAYVAGNNTIYLLDIQNPTSPVIISSITLPGNIQSLFLSNDGNTLYLGDNSGLRVVDVSSQSMSLLGGLNLPRGLREIDISSDGTILYAANTDDGLAVIDVSNSTNPNLIGSYDTIAGVAVTLSEDGTKVFLADQGRKIEVINVTNPLSPVKIGEIENTAHGVLLSTNGDLLYSFNGTNGVSILGVPENSETYSKNNPFVNPKNPKIFTTTLSSFTHTLGSNNEGTISYQVSTDNGASWKYWNGAWVVTNKIDGTETSDIADINSNISTLDANGGSFLWRAYLNSDGTQQVELEEVSLGGSSVSVSLVSPATNTSVINQGWFPIVTEVTCESDEDCGDLELTLDPIGDFFFERTETGGEEDCITDSVCIARSDFDWGIHNSVTESSFNWFDSPAGTQWYNGACGTNPESHTYNNWVDVVGGGWNPQGAIGSPMCLHIVAEDIYIDIEFQSWSWQTGFSYYRSTTGKGIIPTIPTQPFWTNELSNPITINLEAGETHTETFWVYVDGIIDDVFEFFTYITPVGLPDFKQESQRREITITASVANTTPADIILDATHGTAQQPQGTRVGNFNTTDVDSSDIHSYSLSCVNPGIHDGSFQIIGNKLQLGSSSLAAGNYQICVVSYDQKGGRVEKNFELTLQEPQEESTSSKTGSRKLTTSQVNAIFGTPTTTPTESNIFKGKTCSADMLLTQNLKAGARNGQYHSYTKTTVNEVKILQAHMNRLGFKSGPVDGILGPITDGAIKRMQKYLGTRTDGLVGPVTRSLINQSC